MRIYKKTLVKMFFVLEIIVFIGIYFYGGNGLQNLNCLERENKALECEIVKLQNELASLQKELGEWEADDYYLKEQFAREKLQMAKEGDKIYFLQEVKQE